MNQIELVIIALCFVWTTITGFDFMVYSIKSGAKNSVLTKRSWTIGLITATAIVYWFMNGHSLMYK